MVFFPSFHLTIIIYLACGSGRTAKPYQSDHRSSIFPSGVYLTKSPTFTNNPYGGVPNVKPAVAVITKPLYIHTPCWGILVLVQLNNKAVVYRNIICILSVPLDHITDFHDLSSRTYVAWTHSAIPVNSATQQMVNFIASNTSAS